MISDKERREVASALRGDPRDMLIPQSRDGFEGMTYHEAAYRFWDMCRRVRSVADVDIAYSTASVLADLIEPQSIDGDTSDGYHTFNELYHHRAVLFSVIVAKFSDRAWKSKLHADGTMYEGMFIVGIKTPDGQATYHYDVEPYWNLFQCKEVDRAPEWDGHTPDQAIERIGKLIDYKIDRQTCEMEDAGDVPSFVKDNLSTFFCSKCGSPVYNDMNPSYCLYCGARVIK